MKVIVLQNNLNTIGSVKINKQTNFRAAISSVSSLKESISLEDLKNVDAINPQTGYTLVFDQTTNKYIVEELPMVNGGYF